MQKRPTSLTIIGWILIISAIFGLFSVFTMQDNPTAVAMIEEGPLPMSAHIAFSALGVLVTGACGFGVLKGYNWSRYLYLLWSVLSLVISFVMLNAISLLLFGIVFFAVIAFFLFRPAANAWFNREPAPAGE